MTAIPNIPGFMVRAIAESDTRELQALFDADPDYFEMAHARPAAMDEVDQIRKALPPEKTQADKFLHLIIDERNRIAGLTDIIRGFPEPHIWYLGFLYLAKAARGQGLGRRVLQALYPWVRANRGTALRLGVVEENAHARHLYATEGFALQVIREPDPAVDRVRRILVLQRAL
ncbi:MAG: GNAT family N-acetyltransferase [Alphaproteobacteria bacterium]|nr:GNAT family N-acetyltransferase [Alphaproteobacteria bacterium]